jgi:hypothetical protein
MGEAQSNSFSVFFWFALDSRSACKPTLHGSCVDQARLLELKLTPREHREIGNATDVILCRKGREPFRIDLHHDGTAGHVSGGLRDLRRRHPAGSAPGRPKIRQDRDLALANDLIELLLVDFDRLGNCRQLRLASTAFALIRKVRSRNTIRPTTGSAISNEWHGAILGHPSERVLFSKQSK